MINKVEICGVNTSKLPVLSNEEKNRLLNEIKKGNKEAREEFINGNLKLVLSVIKRFYGRGENLDDLFQIGCIGLIKAMDNFDLDLNVQFSTYAVPMIAGEIRRYLRDNNMVRVSRSVRDLAYKVLAVREEALRENKKEPTIDEIAKELGVEKEEIAFCLDAIQDPVSLQEPVYGDDTENIYVEDQIKDKKNSDENWADDITLLEVMKKLKEKRPLKYLYISSACITIILSVILYYKYTKSNVSSSKTNKDTTPFKTCTEKCPQIIDVEFKKGIQTTGTIRCSISEIGSRTLY